ncbi:MAG: VWA domain-containing protein [Archangiaceae bacterium]|nr:VWA domain-containing protein [Archangiaceae bacterium]
MVAEIGNALERDDLPQLRGHFRSGVYDLRRAIQSEFQRQATGRGDPKVFMRRDEPVERRTEIVFCVDISGSMRGDNIAAAREAVVVFQEALHELGLPYGVVAYNGRPLVLAELAVHQDDNREAPLGHLQANGDNNDTGALKVARDMLEGSDANNKVVFFLTDGAAVADTKSYVEQTEAETDIAVIGIGIGAGCGEVPNIYRSHLVVPNIAELARKIGELLGDVIVGNGG